MAVTTDPSGKSPRQHAIQDSLPSFGHPGGELPTSITENQRPHPAIPATTHQNRSVQDLLLLLSHPAVELITRKNSRCQDPVQL